MVDKLDLGTRYVLQNKETGKFVGDRSNITTYDGIQNKDLYSFSKKYHIHKVDMVLSPVDITELSSKPSVHGAGYIGFGKYNPTDDNNAYEIWRGVIRRCKNPKKSESCYKDVSVCDDWLNFQLFAEWYYKNHVDKWVIDKDLLSPEGSKVYSPETCCYLPSIINTSIFKLGYLCMRRAGRSSKKVPKVCFTIEDYRYRIRVHSVEEAIQVVKTRKQELFNKNVLSRYSDNIRPDVLKILETHFLDLPDHFMSISDGVVFD